MASSPTPDRRLLQARTLAFGRVLPPVLLFSLVDAALLTLYFWPEVDHGFLVAWTGAMVLHCGFWSAFAWWSLRAIRLPHPAWMVGLAVEESALFSLFLIVAFAVSGSEKAALLTGFATGLLAAGGLSRMSLPVPALVFLSLQGIGTGIAVLGARFPSPWIVELFIAMFVAALAMLVMAMSRVFDARVAAEVELARQRALMSHQLMDFEESASEGLWEADAEGRIVWASARLAELLSTPAEALLNVAVLPQDGAADVLARGLPFRNLIVPVEIGAARRWWSLTGKPLRDHEGRVTGWRGVGSDVTGTRLQELEMLRLSRYDTLTGLLNRHSFRSLLDSVLTPGTQESRCLVLIDLVDFKDVNESRGHAFGDALLQAVAHRLRHLLPEPTVVARLDGDEFAVVTRVEGSPQSTAAALEAVLEELTEPYSPCGQRFEAGFRVGAAFSPEDAVTSDQWLRCADLALRTSKLRSRNRLVVYTADLLESFRRRNLLKEDMKGAIGRGEFQVVFQPIVHLSEGRVRGCEALVRWAHPVQGPVSPSDFIPLAEETEGILALGLWVLGQACRTAMDWPKDVAVSVNVSGVQLRSGALAGDVAQVLNHLGFDPRRLILEVTESALIRDDGTVGRTLDALKAQGIRLALDDFGTGYSSLSYLQSFPFDKLKIDQSFIRPLSEREGAPAILASIISLARALNLATTAEGVEDEAHRILLSSLGCDEGQGYLFFRPLTAQQLPEAFAVRYPS